MSPTVSDHDNDSGRHVLEERPDALELLQQLLAELREQTRHLAALRAGAEIDSCLLEQIGRIVCMTANETHCNGHLLEGMAESLAALLAMYRGAHPDQALQLERLAKVEAELRRCCPGAAPPALICHFEPCEPHRGLRPGDGYSAKSRGVARPLQVDPQPHEPWTIEPHEMHEEEFLPAVPRGPLVGAPVPVAATARPLDFRSGGGAFPGGGTQEPVTFRTFTESGVATGIWPPDMSGAKAGDVVVMSGNLWLKLSLDGGKTFTDVDFTKVFAASKTYGSWAGDQVIHYVPQIDCFVLYVQSKAGAKGSANQSKNVVKVALASPADLKKFKGGKAAWWRQWDFTSDDFGITAWMDFPDLTYGDAFLYINTNAFTRTFDSAGKEQNAFAGKLFFELPLKELQAGSGFSYYYAMLTESLSYGSPTQNVRDENYWAAHVNNSTMRIYSSKGNDPNYYWRERKLKANWPMATNNANGVPDIVSSAPDSGDWISTEHRIIGATKVVNQLWFAWTAANGKSDAGGFEFPKPHVQIAKFDLTQDYACVEQMQVWNPDVAYAYASLTTNSNNEVGISLAWGGGSTAFGSHAVGILGDFVVWFGDASEMTSTRTSPTRFGDYLHVRLAYPDTRFFSAFGYAVNTTSATPPAEDDRYIYVEFGREAIAPSPLH